MSQCSDSDCCTAPAPGEDGSEGRLLGDPGVQRWVPAATGCHRCIWALAPASAEWATKSDMSEGSDASALAGCATCTPLPSPVPLVNVGCGPPTGTGLVAEGPGAQQSAAGCLGDAVGESSLSADGREVHGLSG